MRDAEAHVVFEKDIEAGFKLTFEAGRTYLKHPFSFTPEDKRGKPLGAYAVLRFVNGGQHIEPMSWDEIMKAKAVNPFSADADSPWQKWPYEQAKKTSLKRASKWAPTGRDYRLLAAAHDADFDRGETVESQARVTELKTVAPPVLSAESSVVNIETAREPEQLEQRDFEAICKEVYASDTFEALDAVVEKYTGWQGKRRAEVAERFKERRKEIAAKSKTRGDK